MIPMLLGILLDGIPESLVIGLGILEGGSVSLAMLAAVFISNLPTRKRLEAGGAQPGQWWMRCRLSPLRDLCDS